jgi:hypothetical protein
MSIREAGAPPQTGTHLWSQLRPTPRMAGAAVRHIVLPRVGSAFTLVGATRRSSTQVCHCRDSPD